MRTQAALLPEYQRWPALAVAGQGDVLTGLIAALLAQGMPALAASCLAVRVHGLAGDEYQQEAGGPIGLTASATALRCSGILNQLITKYAAAGPARVLLCKRHCHTGNNPFVWKYRSLCCTGRMEPFRDGRFPCSNRRKHICSG
jgi:hypothetical protein